MAKKKFTSIKQPTTPATSARAAVTPERFVRLHRLVKLLSSGECSREQLTQQLGLDVRGFYRDLEALRGVAIQVKLHAGQYSLAQKSEEAIARLPFPDPLFSLGEMRQLARGKSKLHMALQERIKKLLA